MQYVVNNLVELQALATDVLHQLPPGTALLLSGELGSGKTTFTQAIARQLGVTIPVTSPTFTIVGEYATINHSTIQRLIHADLYRLADQQAGQDPGIQEVLQQVGQPDILVVIEWPEKLGSQLPQPAQWIDFKMGDKPTERVVRVD